MPANNCPRSVSTAHHLLGAGLPTPPKRPTARSPLLASVFPHYSLLIARCLLPVSHNPQSWPLLAQLVAHIGSKWLILAHLPLESIVATNSAENTCADASKSPRFLSQLEPFRANMSQLETATDKVPSALGSCVGRGSRGCSHLGPTTWRKQTTDPKYCLHANRPDRGHGARICPTESIVSTPIARAARTSHLAVFWQRVGSVLAVCWQCFGRGWQGTSKPSVRSGSLPCQDFRRKTDSAQAKPLDFPANPSQPLPLLNTQNVDLPLPPTKRRRRSTFCSRSFEWSCCSE